MWGEFGAKIERGARWGSSKLPVFMQLPLDHEWEYLKVKSHLGEETFCDVVRQGLWVSPSLGPCGKLTEM